MSATDSDYEPMSGSAVVDDAFKRSGSVPDSSLPDSEHDYSSSSDEEQAKKVKKIDKSKYTTVSSTTITTTTTPNTTPRDLAAAPIVLSTPAATPRDAEEPEKKDVQVDDSEYYGKIRLDDDEVLETDADRVVVSLRNIHKTYLLGVEGVPALRGVTATIYKGEFVCIFGTSGGGKTTMLNIIGTIDRPSKGDIFLCGTHITPRTPDKVLSELRLAKMGFVFQTFNLLSAMTAVENVELPMILRGDMTARQRRLRAMELLERVGMEKRANHLPSQLSGGEQQRVTIARAMANNPDILLLDEPTGDLDTHNTAVAMKLLSDLHKQGVTLIMVTHDVNLKYFADRVIWMRDGLVQRIEHTTPIQRKDCMMRMEEELSKKKKKVTKNDKPEFEVRQPESYEPFAFAMQKAQQNEEEQRRLMISLGLAPDTSQDVSGEEIEAQQEKKKKKKAKSEEPEQQQEEEAAKKEEEQKPEEQPAQEGGELKKKKKKKKSKSKSHLAQEKTDDV